MSRDLKGFLKSLPGEAWHSGQRATFPLLGYASAYGGGVHSLMSGAWEHNDFHALIEAWGGNPVVAGGLAVAAVAIPAGLAAVNAPQLVNRTAESMRFDSMRAKSKAAAIAQAKHTANGAMAEHGANAGLFNEGVQARKNRVKKDPNWRAEKSAGYDAASTAFQGSSTHYKAFCKGCEEYAAATESKNRQVAPSEGNKTVDSLTAAAHAPPTAGPSVDTNQDLKGQNDVATDTDDLGPRPAEGPPHSAAVGSGAQGFLARQDDTPGVWTSSSNVITAAASAPAVMGSSHGILSGRWESNGVHQLFESFANHSGIADIAGASAAGGPGLLAAIKTPFLVKNMVESARFDDADAKSTAAFVQQGKRTANGVMAEQGANASLFNEGVQARKSHTTKSKNWPPEKSAGYDAASTAFQGGRVNFEAFCEGCEDYIAAAPPSGSEAEVIENSVQSLTSAANAPPTAPVDDGALGTVELAATTDVKPEIFGSADGSDTGQADSEADKIAASADAGQVETEATDDPGAGPDEQDPERNHAKANEPIEPGPAPALEARAETTEPAEDDAEANTGARTGGPAPAPAEAELKDQTAPQPDEPGTVRQKADETHGDTDNPSNRESGLDQGNLGVNPGGDDLTDPDSEADKIAASADAGQVETEATDDPGAGPDEQDPEPHHAKANEPIEPGPAPALEARAETTEPAEDDAEANTGARTGGAAPAPAEAELKDQTAPQPDAPGTVGNPGQSTSTSGINSQEVGVGDPGVDVPLAADPVQPQENMSAEGIVSETEPLGPVTSELRGPGDGSMAAAEPAAPESEPSNEERIPVKEAPAPVPEPEPEPEPEDPEPEW